jgi:hypothetical protein
MSSRTRRRAAARRVRLADLRRWPTAASPVLRAPAVQMAQAWAAAGEAGTRESIDDLYSIRLHETIGQGGQGVVFRGLMHGLEVAVKVGRRSSFAYHGAWFVIHGL